MPEIKWKVRGGGSLDPNRIYSGPNARAWAARVRDADGIPGTCELLWSIGHDTGWQREPCLLDPELVEAWLNDDYEFQPF